MGGMWLFLLPVAAWAQPCILVPSSSPCPEGTFAQNLTASAIISTETLAAFRRQMDYAHLPDEVLDVLFGADLTQQRCCPGEGGLSATPSSLSAIRRELSTPVPPPAPPPSPPPPLPPPTGSQCQSWCTAHTCENVHLCGACTACRLPSSLPAPSSGYEHARRQLSVPVPPPPSPPPPSPPPPSPPAPPPSNTPKSEEDVADGADAIAGEAPPPTHHPPAVVPPSSHPGIPVCLCVTYRNHGTASDVFLCQHTKRIGECYRAPWIARPEGSGPRCPSDMDLCTTALLPPPPSLHAPPPVGATTSAAPREHRGRDLAEPPFLPPTAPRALSPRAHSLPDDVAATIAEAETFASNEPPHPRHGRELQGPAAPPVTPPPPPSPMPPTSPSWPPPTPPAPPYWPLQATENAFYPRSAIVIDLGVGLVVLAMAIVCAAAACLVRVALLRNGHDTAERDALHKQAVLARATRAVLQTSCPEGGAVPQWQQAVVAIGSRPEGGGPPRLVGSGFFVDAEAHVLVTCCHVIDDIVLAHRNGSARVLDPTMHGVAIGFGSPAVWTHVARVRYLSPPPAPRDARNGLDLAVLQLVSPLPAHSAVPSPAPSEASSTRLDQKSCGVGSSGERSSGESSCDGGGEGSGGDRGSKRDADGGGGVSPTSAALCLLEAGELEAALMPAHATVTDKASTEVGRAAPLASRTASPEASSTSSDGVASIAASAHGRTEPIPSPTPRPSSSMHPSPPALSPAALSPAVSQSVAASALVALPCLDAAVVSLPRVTALSLGHESQLTVGEDVVLLGYGRAGRGGPPSATNTRGVFAGRCEHPQTGGWLRTDALMLSGHSGGPLLNSRGEVVGWSVRSGFDKVVNGEGYYAAGLNEVRPASALEPAVVRVLGGRMPVATLPAGALNLVDARARDVAIAAIERALADDVALAHHASAASASTSTALSHFSASLGRGRSASPPTLESSDSSGSGDLTPSRALARPSRRMRRHTSRLRKGSGSGGGSDGSGGSSSEGHSPSGFSFGLRSSHLSFSIKIRAPSLPRLGRRDAGRSANTVAMPAPTLGSPPPSSPCDQYSTGKPSSSANAPLETASLREPPSRREQLSWLGSQASYALSAASASAMAHARAASVALTPAGMAGYNEHHEGHEGEVEAPSSFHAAPVAARVRSVDGPGPLYRV